MVADVLKIGIPFIILAGTGLIAWGATGEKIQSLERAVAVQTTIQAQQADLRVQAARTEAKSAQAAEQAKQNHDLLLQLLQRLGK